MKKIKVLLLIVVSIISGCSSMKPVDVPPEELQAKIMSERDLIKVGDYLEIKTLNGETKEFEVVAIDFDNELILGKDISVKITDIDSIKREGFSIIKSAGATIGIYTILLILAAPALILSGG